MPNRIIKESICTSANLDNLNWQEEVLFYRILVNCDDYGRMDARIPILKAKCFPLRIDAITDSSILTCLQSLAQNRLLVLYMVDGQDYLQVATWDKHQQIRAKKSKYPAPTEQNISLDSTYNQVIASDSICPRNPIQSNTIQYNTENKSLAVVIKSYEENVGTLTPMIVELIKDALNIYSQEWLIDAIKISVERNTRKWSYIDGILRKWQVDGKNNGHKPKTPTKTTVTYRQIPPRSEDGVSLNDINNTK